MKQDERLLKHLLKGRSIDGIRAWHVLGIYRLSACIHRLRRQGWNIQDRWNTGKNRFKEEVRWKVYFIPKEDR